VSRFISWNVRALVQAWVDGTYPNHGILLTKSPGTPWGSREGAELSFTSRESAITWLRPYLWVRWHLPTSTPSPTPTSTPTTTPTPTPRAQRLWLPVVWKG